MLVLLTNSGTLGTFLFSLPNLPKPNLCYPYGAMFSKPLEGGRAPSAPAPAREAQTLADTSDQILVKICCGCFLILRCAIFCSSFQLSRSSDAMTCSRTTSWLSTTAARTPTRPGPSTSPAGAGSRQGSSYTTWICGLLFVQFLETYFDL